MRVLCCVCVEMVVRVCVVLCVYMWSFVLCVHEVLCVHVVLCVCVSLLTCLFLFFFLLFSFSLHAQRTETRSDRQVSPPTKNGHAPRDPLNQDFSLLLSPSPLFFFFFFFSFLYPCLSRSLLSHAQL